MSAWDRHLNPVMQKRDKNDVDAHFSQIAIQLTTESHARRHPANASRHGVAQLSIREDRQLESAKTSVVQRLIVQQHAVVCVLDELVSTSGIKEKSLRCDRGFRSLSTSLPSMRVSVSTSTSISLS